MQSGKHALHQNLELFEMASFFSENRFVVLGPRVVQALK
jgi:hypothetical protein